MAFLSDSAILRHIARQPKKMASHKQLLRELGVRGEARRELTDRLYALVAKGELLQVDSDRYAIPQATTGRNLLVGRLTMHRDGFGFVIPEVTSLDDSLKSRLAGDVFIPPHAIGSSMHGDRVLVEVSAVRPDGRAEGRIVRSLARAHPTVVGIFHYGGRHNYVKPIDQKVTQEIVIPAGMENPKLSSAEGAEKNDAESNNNNKEGSSKAKHRVIGSEAKVHADWQDLEGLVVDVEITDWPSATQNPRGRVIEILGQEDDFGVDVEIMIRKFHLPHRFPPEVIEEAQAIQSDNENIISEKLLSQRRDYRALPIVTIDGETARDFDDAVHVRQLENGNYELQVHIADVAQYVTPNSPLDQEARLRGTSVYFPDRAVPMLPLELSTDICSLRPQVDRLVLSCTMEIDHQGEIAGYEINEGVIRSANRMTYTAVNAVIEGDGSPGSRSHLSADLGATAREKYATQVQHFELMRDLAMILNRKRERRGSIDFDLPEPVIEFDEFGMMKSITRSERNVAHRLIEEFMLSANECVAHYLENKRIASLYRIHEKPDAKRVYDFEVIAATFGYSLGVGPLPIQRVQLKADRRDARGTGKRVREIEVPKEVHVTPRMYQKLTEKIAGKPEGRILSFLMLRSLKQARYSEENRGHFALAATTYTHFTSPIRRYPDLIVHRILKDVLRESSEKMDGEVPVGTSLSVSLQDCHPERSEGPASRLHKKEDRDGPPPSPWSKRRDRDAHQHALEPLGGPITLEELHIIADESSQSERRADEAERGLMEWKKVKFMERRIGEDFDGLIISVTKFGFFVELTDLFVEGLVPLNTLGDGDRNDRYTYQEDARQIIGQRTGRTYGMGDRVRVLVDRIDAVEKKIQFAVLEEEPKPSTKRAHK
jgi:ribonuclease R